MNSHDPKHTAAARDDAVLTYAQKHRQANREALYTVVALAATIVVWVALGFGLSGLDVELFSTPLWVIGGTVGTWVFAIVATVVLAKRLFRDFDLDDDPHATEQVEQESGTLFQNERCTRPLFQKSASAHEGGRQL